MKRRPSKLKTKILFLSVCVAALLAAPALCSSAPPIDFAVDCIAGSVPGTWDYTLYNNCTYTITLDSLGVYGSSGYGISGVDPSPSDWEIITDDPADNYPDYWQVTWYDSGDNVPTEGNHLGGFIVDPGTSSDPPSQFEVIYFDDLQGLEPQYFQGTVNVIVPEPSSLLALATAIPGLGIAAFRRRRS
jgi:hypothetical protein